MKKFYVCCILMASGSIAADEVTITNNTPYTIRLKKSYDEDSKTTFYENIFPHMMKNVAIDNHSSLFFSYQRSPNSQRIDVCQRIPEDFFSSKIPTIVVEYKNNSVGVTFN